MASRVFLIRHGATQLSAEDRFAGSVDVLLSDEGREQARCLGERLAGEPIAAVYTSPMKRTIATAELVARPHGVALETVGDFREIDHGRWEGRSRAEVERDFGTEYQRWENDPYTFAPDGGESGLQVTARALPALLRLVERHANDTFAVISHKATIRLLLSSILGFDPRRYRDRLDQNPAALNVLDFRTVAHARLTLFNDVSHYTAAKASLPSVPHNRLSKVWG